MDIVCDSATGLRGEWRRESGKDLRTGGCGDCPIYLRADSQRDLQVELRRELQGDLQEGSRDDFQGDFCSVLRV